MHEFSLVGVINVAFLRKIIDFDTNVFFLASVLVQSPTHRFNHPK